MGPKDVRPTHPQRELDVTFDFRFQGCRAPGLWLPASGSFLDLGGQDERRQVRVTVNHAFPVL